MNKLISVESKIKSLEKKVKFLEKSSENNYFDFYNKLNLGIIKYDINGKIVKANIFATKFLNLNARKIVGNKITSVLKGIDEYGHKLTPKNHPLQTSVNTNERIANIIIGIEDRNKQKYRWIEINSAQAIHKRDNIHNIFFFREIKNLTAESDLLRLNHKLSLALSTTTSLNLTLDLLLDVSCQVNGIDGGAIYLTDKLTGGLRLVSHYGVNTQALKYMAKYDFAAPETRLAMKGEPVYSSSRNIDDDIFAFKFMGKKGSKFFAIIPVKYDNRIVASINLYSYRINKISFNSLLALEAFAMRAGAIIARVNAVWALQENEQKYRSLLETMNEGFIIIDDDFMITYVNNRICEMLEYRYDEIIGLPITYFFDETNKKLLYNQMRRRSRGNQKPYEITWLKADGRNIATIVAPKAILNESGQFKGSFAVITDISELKETSKILKKKEQDLIEKTSILQEVNTALRVLLKKRDEDKNELEEKVLLNVKQLINPIIRKIKKTGLDQKQKTLFDIIESNLSDIISPYSRSLFSKHLELTPTEFDISNFIRDGKTTKEISEVMNLSNRTIETHRFRIRKKLGLNKKRVSLRSYLLSLQ